MEVQYLNSETGPNDNMCVCVRACIYIYIYIYIYIQTASSCGSVMQRHDLVDSILCRQVQLP